MMSLELYYTPPSEKVFNEIRNEAIKIWEIYGATSKINLIKELDNVDDNYMYIYAMFDHVNQEKLYDVLKPSTRKLIREALNG